MRRVSLVKRIAACLVTVALSAGVLAGCGKAGGDGADVGTVDTDHGEASDETADGGEAQGTAMGRFVERNVELGGDSLTDWNSRVFKQEDGSLLIADNSGFVLCSHDNGDTWTREDLPWLTQMSEEGKWIMSMAFGTDKTAAVVWTEPMDQNSADEINMQLSLFKPDNTEVPVEIKLSAGDLWVSSVYISDTGRIFANAAGPNLYEVKEDGSSEVFLTIDAISVDLVRFHGNLMLIDGRGLEAPLIYDMDKQEYIEDEVLADFVKENFGDRDLNAGRSYDMFLVSGGDDAIYVAGQQGVYRHVLGGSAMELVVDGSLNILGNPAYSIMDMFVVNRDEFLVAFMGGKLVRFDYDPNIPSRPNETLKVWSLEDKPLVRQAVSQYQTVNPAVYVEYEVGRDGNAVTRDDAIKNLNTRMIAGDGPDVVILDDLPIDSYIEKGILMDIAPLLDGMSGDEAVFNNVVEAFREDGHVYAVPCELWLPFVLGKNSDLNKMTDISGIADAMEEMRENNPGADLLQIPSPIGIMRLFAQTSAPAWLSPEGTIDQEAISDFLTQTKRMYDAQMDGLSEEAISIWDGWAGYYSAYESVYGETWEESAGFRKQYRAIYNICGMQQFVSGALGDVSDYNCLLSVLASERTVDYGVIPANGQCSNVFCARSLMGVSATSKIPERAQEFIKTALGGEVQAALVDGIPVTKQAILDNYAEQWRIYKDNDYISGSFNFVGFEEIEDIEDIRVPDEKKVNELIQWIESMDTAYVENRTFENVVYEEGVSYILGEKSLEEVMEAVETKLGIYLSE